MVLFAEYLYKLFRYKQINRLDTTFIYDLFFTLQDYQLTVLFHFITSAFISFLTFQFWKIFSWNCTDYLGIMKQLNIKIITFLLTLFFLIIANSKPRGDKRKLQLYLILTSLIILIVQIIEQLELEIRRQNWFFALCWSEIIY